MFVDEFFRKNDEVYKETVEKIESLEAYKRLVEQLYTGGDGRQMQLSDMLSYILLSRGLWILVQRGRRADRRYRSEYLKLLLYAVNAVLLQEHLWCARYLTLRRKFMEYVETGMRGRNMYDLFFKGEDIRRLFEETKILAKDLDYRPGSDTKKHYRMLDSLMPKPVGLAIELITYAHLIRFVRGYTIPLVLFQRLLGKDTHIIPPDYLVITNGKIYGVEVKQAGVTPEHVFTFMGETSIPVLMAKTPNVVPLRCPVCKKWIVYCDKVIETFADLDKSVSYFREKRWRLACADCEMFGEGACKYAIYYGKTRTRDKPRHYHYQCVAGDPVVKENIKRAVERHFLSYIPHVEGLESLETA